MSDDGFSTELILRDGDDEVKLPDITRPILLALHNSLVDVEESNKTRFHSPTLCKTSDIEQLVGLLSQWIDVHGPLSRTAKITCVVHARDKMKGNKRHSFKSLATFLEGYSGITDPTSTIIVTFAAVLKLAEKDMLDKLTLEVELKATTSGGYIEVTNGAEEDFDAPAERHFSSDYYNLTANIRYTNYLIARGMLDVVEDWFKALPVVQKPINRSKLINNVIQDNFFEAFPLGKSLVSFVSVFSPAAIIYSAQDQIISALGVAELTPQAVLFVYAFGGGALYLFFGQLFRMLGQVGYPRTRHLLLNAGDERAMERYQNKFASYMKKRNLIINTIIIGFIVSVAASVFVGWF